MKNPVIKTLAHLQNQPETHFQWRRETIITQTKNAYSLFAHFYFPDTNRVPPTLIPFWMQRLNNRTPSFFTQTPIGLFCSLALSENTQTLPNTDFLIFDLSDVLTHHANFQRCLKQKKSTQKIVLSLSDNALLSITDLTVLPFDFIYLPVSENTVSFPEKTLFKIETADDYHHLSLQNPTRLGGTFIDTFLAQKRYQKCPFKKECTSADCVRFGTHPDQILKCANPLFLEQTLTEPSHEIR